MFLSLYWHAAFYHLSSNWKYKTVAQQKEMWCPDAPRMMSDICVLLLRRLELCQRPACCIQQRCGCKRGDHILGSFFFFLPREQAMVSWNNAADESPSKENKALTSWVLKAHSWANTLSCYNQASVNFHCRLKLRKRENLLQWFGLTLSFFVFHRSFYQSPHIPLWHEAQGALVGLKVCLFPFTSGLGSK